MLAHTPDLVIGVDSHADCHALALVEGASGAVLAQAALGADRRGYRQALRLARAHAGERLWAIEGTGSYGAGLARFLEREGERVVEVERPRRGHDRGRAKTDALDALRAARAALAGEPLPEPRRGGEREALRVLLATREAAVAVRRAGLNELHALVVTAPDELRERLRGQGREALLHACRALRPQRRAAAELHASALALRSCARRVAAATAEAAALERELVVLVQTLAPQLLAQPGVGPITAAQLLVAWSHPGRLRSEAAFARLGGVAPIAASSGKLVRHRLDRGGDRQLNRALHTIVLTRRRCDQTTIAYIARRRASGKTEREAVRCLKRYVARSLFRLLEGMPAAT